MQAKTVRDLGALVRAERTTRGMTQADLAHELRVSRDWVVRLEKGHPRLEAQRVLDALLVLGLTLDVNPAPTTAPPKTTRPPTSAKNTADPFDALFRKKP
jgi:y4mF family transcriptional regulator